MSDCIFCKIANNEIKADKVYEDNEIIAFNDINPKAPVHILIVPKKHIPTLNDLEDFSIIGKMFEVAVKLAKEKNIAKEGYRTVINCNSAGGQAVYHIHLHLLGGRTMEWPPG